MSIVTEERIDIVKQALKTAIKHPWENAPFIVLSIIDLSCFVQYRASATETLLLDIPILKRQTDYGLNPDDANLTKAVMTGLETLYVWVVQDTLKRFTVDNVTIDMEEFAETTGYVRSTLPRIS